MYIAATVPDAATWLMTVRRKSTYCELILAYRPGETDTLETGRQSIYVVAAYLLLNKTYSEQFKFTNLLLSIFFFFFLPRKKKDQLIS